MQDNADTAARMANRFHPSEHMRGLGELAEISSPVAVVVRPDGSLDVYGDVPIIDQRVQHNDGSE